MIRCPTCGTLNQDSHKSCDNCGKTLPQTKVRCPKCGTLNSVGNLLCDNCNTRLIQPEGIIPSNLPAESGSRAESSLVKGISLPTRATADDSDVPHTGADELPDWLRGLTEESEEFFETAGKPAEEPEEDKADTSSGYPDWLSGLLDENTDFGAVDERDEPERETQDELTFESDALPDWFVGEAVPDDELTPDSADDNLSELPDWLLATTDTKGMPVEASDAPGLPDWLTASATATPTETPMDSELPEWLAEAQALTTDTDTNDAYRPAASTDTLDAKTQPATREPLTQPAAESPLSADLPDWLSAVDDSQESGSIGLPDWLRESSETSTPDMAAQPHTESPGAGKEEVTTSAVAEATASEAGEVAPTDTPEMPAVSPASPEPEPADLPEWLSDLGAGPAALGGAAIFTSDDEIPGELTAQSQEQPGWLEDIKPSTEGAQYEPAAPAFVQGDAGIDWEEEPTPSADEPVEMPDWLRGLDISEPKQPQAPPHIFEGEMPAPAELPSWLQALKPQSSPAAISGISDEPVNADIPDWLQALRPEPGEAGEAPPRRATLPTPAEPEGPLQGVPGVLQPFALIDAPADVKTIAATAVPEAVIAQAQLWQSLLERPRSAQRPVSHARSRSEATVTVIRLLVAAILMLGILGAFLLLPKGMRLATALPVQIAPGAPALIESLDALQPGDRVIVAVEYGMAYAEEMSQIAIPVLQQLTAQQAEITIVSTRPEGAVLGAALAAETGLSQFDGGYLAGNAGGISAFLSQPDAQAARHVLVLASQPERLRWWIEQVQLAYGSAPVPVSLSVGVSASAGPIIAPYLRTLQIQGWLVGLPDALAYRELRGVEDTDYATRTLDVLMLAHWAAGGLLVIGLFVSLVAGKKGAR
jgi:hypothetical protein